MFVFCTILFSTQGDNSQQQYDSIEIEEWSEKFDYF